MVFYVTLTIFQLYISRHRCAGGLRKKLYLWSGSRPSTDTGPPFLYGDSDKPPHIAALYDTLGKRRTYSPLKPRRPHWAVENVLRVWVYWCFTSHATIFQSYMWRHICAGGLKELYLRSGSQHHRHFAGFFNVPVFHRHGTTLFIRWFRQTAPFSRLLRHDGDKEDVYST